jgi:hypothetical protein
MKLFDKIEVQFNTGGYESPVFPAIGFVDEKIFKFANSPAIVVKDGWVEVRLCVTDPANEPVRLFLWLLEEIR